MITDMCWEHAMKLGVALPLSDIGGDPATVRLFAQAAEAAGYDHLHFPGFPHIDRAGYRSAKGRTGRQNSGSDEYISSRY